MDNKVSGIERAFQLAKSGLVRDIDELRVVLKKEAKARKCSWDRSSRNNYASSLEPRGRPLMPRSPKGDDGRVGLIRKDRA
jgi:hypothetical protein